MEGDGLRTIDLQSAVIANTVGVVPTSAFYVRDVGDDERGLDHGSDVVVAWATVIVSAVPNPFNPKTTVSYYVPESGHMELAVFDISSRVVNENVGAGKHSVAWTGVDQHGSHAASGVYFFRMRAGGVVDTKRVVMIK